MNDELDRQAKRQTGRNVDHSRTIHQVAASLRRQQDRTTTPLPRRLAQALNRAALMSTVRAQSTETGKLHAVKPETQLPVGTYLDQAGDLQVSLDINKWANYVAAITHHIELWERALDDEQGLGEARHYATLTGAELDQQILEQWKGVPSHVVATKAPWLGGQRTIERTRARNGLTPSRGEERSPKAA